MKTINEITDLLTTYYGLRPEKEFVKELLDYVNLTNEERNERDKAVFEKEVTRLGMYYYLKLKSDGRYNAYMGYHPNPKLMKRIYWDMSSCIDYCPYTDMLKIIKADWFLEATPRVKVETINMSEFK